MKYIISTIYWCIFSLSTVFDTGYVKASSDLAVERSLIFSGVDVSSNSGFFYAGVRHNFSNSFDDSGWIFGSLQGAGVYRYKNTSLADGHIVAAFTVVDTAVGYQHRWETGAVAILAGFHQENHSLSVVDPGNHVQGAAAGPSILIDMWAKPDANILMTAYVSATSVYGSYYSRLFAGRRVSWLWNGFLGPELALMGNDTYWEVRLGAQLNSVNVGPWGLSASFGTSQNQDNNSSLYGSLSLWRKLDFSKVLRRPRMFRIANIWRRGP